MATKSGNNEYLLGPLGMQSDSMPKGEPVSFLRWLQETTMSCISRAPLKASSRVRLRVLGCSKVPLTVSAGFESQ